MSGTLNRILYVSYDLRLTTKISSENFVPHIDGKRSARPFHRCKVHVQQSSFSLHFDSSLFALLPYCCTGDTRMWVRNMVDSRDGASPRCFSRCLLNSNSSARTSCRRQLVRAEEFEFRKVPSQNRGHAPSRSLRLWETYSSTSTHLCMFSNVRM